MNIATRIPSGREFVEKDYTASYNLRYWRQSMLEGSSTEYAIDLNMINSTFAYNWFYANLQQNQSTFYETKAVSPGLLMEYTEECLLSYTFSLTSVAIVNDWQRVSFMSMLGDLGGVTALIVFFIGGLV